MRRNAAWYVGLTTLAVAAVLSHGGPADLSLAGLSSANAPATGAAFGSSGSLIPDIELPALADLMPARDKMHGPSLAIGVVLGFALAFASQVSWFELPRRMLRWLIANERNFYRVGLAGICLAVLLFY